MKKLIYKIITIINLLAVIALALSYLSVYINPKQIWLVAFFGLAYPFLLFLNIFFLFFWVYHWKRQFLISLIIILLGWNYMAGFFQFPNKNKEPIPENSFKFISYNVRLFNRYNWADNKQAGKEMIQFVKTEQAEIVCFQEFYLRKDQEFNLRHVKNELSDLPYSHIGSVLETNSYIYGIATFSKHPIINKGIIKYPSTNNISIYTDIQINKDTIRIFNNHLQSIRFDRRNYKFIKSSKIYKDDARMEELKAISYRLRDAFIKRAEQVQLLKIHLDNSPYPVVVCGDFNDTPVSYTYQQLQKKYKDAFLESGKWFGTTYRGSFPSYRIDYVLYEPSLESHVFEIPRLSYSDHYPVVTVLSIPPKKPSTD